MVFFFKIKHILIEANHPCDEYAGPQFGSHDIGRLLDREGGRRRAGAAPTVAATAAAAASCRSLGVPWQRGMVLIGSTGT